MEEIINSAGAGTAETSGGANAEGSVIPNAKREGSRTESSSLQKEGEHSPAVPLRDDGKAVCGDTSSAPSGHLPLKGKASERLQIEGGPSVAAPPRDDISGAEGSVIPRSRESVDEESHTASGRLQGEGPYGAAVTFAARSARLADEAEALYAEWTSAAKELSRDYPGFDLAAAAK